MINVGDLTSLTLLICHIAIVFFLLSAFMIFRLYYRDPRHVEFSKNRGHGRGQIDRGRNYRIKFGLGILVLMISIK